MATHKLTRFVCDRCGLTKESAEGDYSGLELVIRHYFPRKEKEIWLCKECKRAFSRFMRGMIDDDGQNKS